MSRSFEKTAVMMIHRPIHRGEMQNPEDWEYEKELFGNYILDSLWSRINL